MSHVITRAQRRALATLLGRHARFPNHSRFFAGLLGTHTAAALRKLEPSGFVLIDRMAENCFQYSITDSGRDFLAGRLKP